MSSVFCFSVAKLCETNSNSFVIFILLGNQFMSTPSVQVDQRFHSNATGKHLSKRTCNFPVCFPFCNFSLVAVSLAVRTWNETNGPEDFNVKIEPVSCHDP